MSEFEPRHQPLVLTQAENVAMNAWNANESEKYNQMLVDPRPRAIKLFESEIATFQYLAYEYLAMEKEFLSQTRNPQVDDSIQSLNETLKTFGKNKVIEKSKSPTKPDLLEVHLTGKDILRVKKFSDEVQEQFNVGNLEKKLLDEVVQVLLREYDKSPIVEKKGNKLLSKFRRKS